MSSYALLQDAYNIIIVHAYYIVHVATSDSDSTSYMCSGYGGRDMTLCIEADVVEQCRG